MKRLLFASLLCGIAFAAGAQNPAPTAVEPADPRAVDAANEASASRFCLQQTGSRITASQNGRLAKADRKCAPVTGHAYSRRDLERTGELTLADALRRLDPTIH